MKILAQYDEIAMNQTKMGTKIISNVAISSDISARLFYNAKPIKFNFH